jgi:hypothetical protein
MFPFPVFDHSLFRPIALERVSRRLEAHVYLNVSTQQCYSLYLLYQSFLPLIWHLIVHPF